MSADERTAEEMRVWRKAIAVVAKDDLPSSIYARAAAGDDDALREVIARFEGLERRLGQEVL